MDLKHSAHSSETLRSFSFDRHLIRFIVLNVTAAFCDGRPCFGLIIPDVSKNGGAFICTAKHSSVRTGPLDFEDE
jgi:hypothetical protein